MASRYAEQLTMLKPPEVYHGAMARAYALAAGRPDWMEVRKWIVHDPAH